jgi:hypothetical protein
VRLGSKAVDALHCLILRGQRATVVRRWSPNTRLNGASFVDASLAVGDRLAVGPVELEIVEDIRADQPADNVARAGDEPHSFPDAADHMAGGHAEPSAAAAQEELDRLREQYERDKEEWEQAQARLTSDAENLKREVAQLEGESRSAGHEVGRLEQEMDRLRREIAERDTDAGRLREQVSLRENELDLLREQMAEELAAQRDRLDHEHATSPADNVDPASGVSLDADRPAAPSHGDPTDDSSPHSDGDEAAKSTTDPVSGISFERLPTGSPVSAAAVLARLGQASDLLNESIDDPVGGKLVDAPDRDDSRAVQRAASTSTGSGVNSPKDVAESPEQQPVADVPPADDTPGVAPHVSAGTTPTPAGVANGHEGEESIEDYMSRLMQRLRGREESRAGTPATSKKPSADAATSKSPVVVQNPSSSTHAEPPAKPRARAPEITANFQAMRELANESARSAIRNSSKRKAGIAYGAIAVGLAAAVCGAVLSWVSPEMHSVGFWGAIANFAIAVLCVGYIITQRRRAAANRAKMLRTDFTLGVAGSAQNNDAERAAK